MEKNGEKIRSLWARSEKASAKYINLLGLGVTLLGVGGAFLVFGGGDMQTAELNLKNVADGSYTQTLEDKYVNEPPFGEEIAVMRGKLRVLRGVGNKPYKKSLADKDKPFSENNAPLATDGGDEEKIITDTDTEESGTKKTAASKKTKGKNVFGKVTTASTPKAVKRPTQTTPNSDYPRTRATQTTTEPLPQKTRLPSTNNKPPKVSKIVTTLPKKESQTSENKEETHE